MYLMELITGLFWLVVVLGLVALAISRMKH